MNACGYLRLSTVDQSQYSLEHQERVIRDYCHKNNVNLLAVFKDNGESSYTFDRPDFKALEAFIKQNKNVDYLVISDFDRLSRNLAEALMKIKELQDKFKIKVVATTDSFDTDFTDPSTFMMRAFKFMMAESELWRIKQRTKSGMVQGALNGRHLNMAPFGYLNKRDEANKPILVIDEEKAGAVRFIFQEYLRGTGIEEIRKMAKHHGYNQTSHSAVQKVLSNPVYAGFVKVPAIKNEKERLVKGIHIPIISESDYWQAQARLNKRTVQVQIREEVPLRGVIRCHCGALMTAGNSKGRNKYYWYYLCQKHKVNYSANKVHELFNLILDELSFSKRNIDWFTEKISQEVSKLMNNKGELLATTKKALRQVKDKIETIEEKYLLQPDISKETYNRVRGELQLQLVELERRLNELNAGQAEYLKRINEVLPMLYDIQSVYANLDLARKQQFVLLVFDGFLAFSNEGYRTKSITPIFAHNALKLKEKGLISYDQSSDIYAETPLRTRERN